MATIKEGGSFETFNDPRGNPLISINRDGTISTLGIDFADGTKQITATSSGAVGPAGPAGASVELQTNGVDNGVQDFLNLQDGTDISVTEDGSGNVTFSFTKVILLEKGAGGIVQAGSIGPSTMLSNPLAGVQLLMSIDAAVGIKTAGGAGTHLTLTVSWIQDGITRTQIVANNIDASTTASFAGLTFPAIVDGSTQVTFTITSPNTAVYNFKYGIGTFGQ
jgi:hypothetical protein